MILEFLTSCEKKSCAVKKAQRSPDISPFMLAIHTLPFLPSPAIDSLPSLKSRLYGEHREARKQHSRMKKVIQFP